MSVGAEVERGRRAASAASPAAAPFSPLPFYLAGSSPRLIHLLRAFLCYYTRKTKKEGQHCFLEFSSHLIHDDDEDDDDTGMRRPWICPARLTPVSCPAPLAPVVPDHQTQSLIVQYTTRNGIQYMIHQIPYSPQRVART